MSTPDQAAERPGDDTTIEQTPEGRPAHEVPLLERVCNEQVERWQAGERIPAEEYLARYPVLREDSEAAFELVYSEFLLREAQGETPAPDEYMARFPELAERLQRQLALHGVLQPTIKAAPHGLAGNAAGEGEKPYARFNLDIPGYEVLEELGRGGMGVVYKARHQELNRLVALKVIRPDTSTGAEGAARFRAEAEAVARFQHANIVQIFEVGEHEGLRYLALEYVAGGSLQQKLASTPQDPRGSAVLLAVVAQAIHYAHQRGVVHRDLKPANILLTDGAFRLGGFQAQEAHPPHDLDPSTSHRPPVAIPKIADFGLAKMLEQGEGQTLAGAILGTPSYMAPEQARASAGAITAATDVYALGAILYELLTGHPPFLGSSPLSTLEQVCTQDPLPPSKLQRRIPRDLETICLKCLQKEPRRRYSSARALAEDLQRFVQSRPIKARRAGRVERLWRWCRREPVMAGLLAALLLVVVLGVAGVVTQWLRAEDEAHAQATARLRAERAEADAQDNLYFSLIAQARLEWRLHNVAEADRLLDHCEPGRRGWEWHYLRRINRSDLLGANDASRVFISSVVFSPDGRRLAFTDWAAPFPVEIWDMASGKRLHTFTGPEHPLRLAFSPDGRQLAVSGAKGEALIWDVDTAKQVRVWKVDGSVVYSPTPTGNSKTYLASGSGNAVILWDAGTGREILRYPSPGGRVTFSPNGKHLAISGPKAVEVCEAATGQLVRRLPYGPEGGQADPFFPWEGPELAFRPDGKQLVVASNPPRIWDMTTGLPLHYLARHAGQVAGVAFSPDGRQVATAATDGTVRLWDATSGNQLMILRGHVARACSVCFHPEGWALASGGRQPGDVKLWDLTRHPEYLNLAHVSSEAITFDPDNGRLLVVNAVGRLQSRDPTSGETRQGPRLDLTGEWLTPAQTAVFSANGRRVATIGTDSQTVKVWEAETGKEVAALKGLTLRGVHVALSSDGSRAAAVSLRGGKIRPHRTLQVWDVATRKVLAAFEPERSPVTRTHGVVALSPDGRLIAFDDYVLDRKDGARRTQPCVRLIEVDGKRERFQVPVAGELVSSLAFNANGRLLAVGSDNDRVVVWDTTTGQRLYREELEGPSRRLAFSPDGRRLAGLDREQAVVWDVRTGKRVLVLHVAPPRPFDGGFNPAVAWSRDSRWLVTTNWEGGLSVFDGDSGKRASMSPQQQVPASRIYWWHLLQAEAAVGTPQKSGLAFHLARVRDAEPPDLVARLRRAQLLTRVGAFDRAADDFAAVFAAYDPDSEDAWLDYARVKLLRGDVQGYQRLCARLAALPRRSALGWRWDDAAHICALGPPTANDPGLALRLVERQKAEAPASNPQPGPRERFAAGLALFRAGQWDRAAAQLQEVNKMDRALAPVILPAQAMVLYRQGQGAEARALLKKAGEWRTKEARRLAAEAPDSTFAAVWPDFEILYGEATGLLGKRKR